jgi:hypothetical protein
LKKIEAVFLCCEQLKMPLNHEISAAEQLIELGRELNAAAILVSLRKPKKRVRFERLPVKPRRYTV